MGAARAQLFFDGSADPNPGAIGAGAFLRLPDGATDEIAAPFDYKGTCNVAEYYGLIKGLARAWDLGIRDIEVFGDSQLVVNQCRGEWRVTKPHLAPLHKEANRLASRFASCDIRWIRRDRNEDADRLSKEGMRASKRRGALKPYGEWKKYALAGTVP